jgi:hypothetical protein
MKKESHSKLSFVISALLLFNIVTVIAILFKTEVYSLIFAIGPYLSEHPQVVPVFGLGLLSGLCLFKIFSKPRILSSLKPGVYRIISRGNLYSNGPILWTLDREVEHFNVNVGKHGGMMKVWEAKPFILSLPLKQVYGDQVVSIPILRPTDVMVVRKFRRNSTTYTVENHFASSVYEDVGGDSAASAPTK